MLCIFSVQKENKFFLSFLGRQLDILNVDHVPEIWDHSRLYLSFHWNLSFWKKDFGIKLQ